jgi:hypothetical protein
VVRATPLELARAAHVLLSFGGASARDLLAGSISTIVVVTRDTTGVWRDWALTKTALKIALCLKMLGERRHVRCYIRTSIAFSTWTGVRVLVYVSSLKPAILDVSQHANADKFGHYCYWSFYALNL